VMRGALKKSSVLTLYPTHTVDVCQRRIGISAFHRNMSVLNARPFLGGADTMIDVATTHTRVSRDTIHYEVAGHELLRA
jgi:hypothetical protein